MTKTQNLVMIVRDNFQMTKMLKKSFKDYKKEINSGMV